MYKIFLHHQLLEFWRGRNKASGIITKVLMVFIILYFLLVAIGLGFFMKSFLTKLFPGKDPVLVFNGFILYYFLADFLMRVQLQELPTLSVKPYLTVNLSKKTIIKFLNLRSFFTFFNLLPIFIFLPFVFISIAPISGSLSAMAYTLIVLSLAIFNNFLILYIKRKAGSNGFIILFGVAAMLILAALDYFNIISISHISGLLFSYISQHPLWSLIFILLPVSIVGINSKYLRNNLYLEEISKKEVAKVSTDYPFLNRFGHTGRLVALELKLILRHKRSKSALTMSFLFVLYGLLFYKKQLIDKNSFGSLLFAAIFMTGIFQIVYGQFMYAWQSSHFDGLLTSPVTAKDFLRAKFLMFTLAATLVTMVTFFYGFISWKLILLHLCVYLYNIGFGTVIVLYFACYNRKRLDLTKAASFNWQGVGASQWLLGIPLLLMPFLIYLPFGIYDLPFWGIISIGLFGLITLAMREIWLNLLTRLFIKQRYKIAEGFREH